MRPYTPAPYSTTGPPVTLASITGITQCKWWSVQPLGSSSGRVGDSHIVAGLRGIPFDNITGSAPAGFFAPPIALEQDFYDLTKWYLVMDFGSAYVACGV